MKMGKFSSCRADRGVRPYIIIIIFMWSRQLFAAFVGIVHHLRHALPQPRVGRQRLRREGGAAAVVGVQRPLVAHAAGRHVRLHRTGVKGYSCRSSRYSEPLR